MKIILSIISTLVLVSCQHDTETILKKTWVPISVRDASGKTYDSEYLQYTFTFADSGKFIAQTIGTDDAQKAHYQLLNNQIVLTDEGGIDTLDIVSIDANKLELQLGLSSIITFKPFDAIRK